MTFFDRRPFSSPGGIPNPIREWFRSREETASNLRLDVLTLSSQQGHALRVVHSVFTQRLAYVASDPSVPRAGQVDHKPLCLLSQLSQWGHGSIASSRVPTVLHFHPEATEMSQETLEGGLKD